MRTDYENWKVGDKVKTDFYSNEKDIVRNITDIYPNDECGSGWAISADGGGVCPHCNRPFGTKVTGTYCGVDAAWFELVENK